MASPLLESHAVSPTLSDHGYHPGLSGSDLAIGQAITAVQAQCTGQINQLQTCQRLLEARLQQMSESQTQMMAQMSDMMSHILVLSQPQPQQSQRRQGRPHPGKSMRAKKRKQAQALLEQANSSTSEGASDVDGPVAAAAAEAGPAPAAAVAMPQAAAAVSTPPFGTSAVTEGAEGPGSSPPSLKAAPVPAVQGSIEEVAVAVESAEATATAGGGAVPAEAAARAPSVAQSQQSLTDEGWFDVVAAQADSSAIPSQTGTPQPEPVRAALLSEANKDLLKAAAEEVCGKLLEAAKAELSATSQVAKASLTATLSLAEGLQQQSESAQHDMAAAIEALKQQHKEDAAVAQQAFKEQLAAFKEEMLQWQRSQEALQEEQQKQATNIRTALTDNFATIQSQLDSDFECLRREFQEAQQKNQEPHTDSVLLIRSMGDSVAAVKLDVAELQTRILQLPPQPGTTPARCRVVACHWYKEPRTGNVWKLFKPQQELAEPFLATATTLSDVKVEAAKALWPSEWETHIGPGFWHQLMDVSGTSSRSFQESRCLADLGCREGSLVKLQFCYVTAYVGDGHGRYWWSYEIIG